MQALLGVLYHSIGGIASGSFYMPFNKVKGWAWESYWIVGGLFSWLIVPPLAAWLTVPGFAEIIAASSQQILLFTFLMGLIRTTPNGPYPLLCHIPLIFLTASTGSIPAFFAILLPLKTASKGLIPTVVSSERILSATIFDFGTTSTLFFFMPAKKS